MTYTTAPSKPSRHPRLHTATATLLVLLAASCDTEPTAQPASVALSQAPPKAEPTAEAKPPEVPAPDLKELHKGAGADATALQRGHYLTSAVVDCVHCHTKRDHNNYTTKLGPEYAGGEVFGAEWHMPGVLVTPNLTPHEETGLGSWSDEEIKRAIRVGINKAGERMFPLMPSHYLQVMGDRDLEGIIALLRSLPPTPMASKERTKLAIPRDALPKLPPVDKPVPEIDGSNPVKRGEYLARIANCRTCHSPTQKGQEIEERFLAGGVYFRGPFGEFATPNITPDVKTGIGGWSDEEIKHVLTTGNRKSGVPVKFQIMPWWLYDKLTKDDLNAIVSYLRSLKPVTNDILKKENQFPLGG